MTKEDVPSEIINSRQPQYVAEGERKKGKPNTYLDSFILLRSHSSVLLRTLSQTLLVYYT